MFPARAEMSRKVSRLPYLTLDVPRVSGDEPQVGLRRAFVGVCSPRERGWARVSAMQSVLFSVFPA